jgi:AbrB family looped-hinge helix DNA binding protein
LDGREIARKQLAFRHYRGNIRNMPLARSKLTAQGQISVPAEVRRRLGVGPGSVLEWDEEGEQIIVRRSARYTSEDIHRAVFPKDRPKPRTLADMKDGIRRHARERYARR